MAPEQFQAREGERIPGWDQSRPCSRSRASYRRGSMRGRSRARCVPPASHGAWAKSASKIRALRSRLAVATSFPSGRNSTPVYEVLVAREDRDEFAGHDLEHPGGPVGAPGCDETLHRGPNATAPTRPTDALRAARLTVPCRDGALRRRTGLRSNVPESRDLIRATGPDDFSARRETRRPDEASQPQLEAEERVAQLPDVHDAVRARS